MIKASYYGIRWPILTQSRSVVLDGGVEAMAQNEAVRRKASGSEIPDKLYFRIGDVAKVCEVPAYVLRFWEAEFPQLKPNKGGTGQRLYRRRDVETALRIKRLLYDEGYTILGARQVLKQEQRRTGESQLALAIEATAAEPVKDLRRLQQLRKGLEDLHALLSRPVETGRATAVQSIRTGRTLSFVARTPRDTMNDLFEPEPDVAGTPAEDK